MRHDLPDVYDDRPLRGPRPPRTWLWALAALLLLIAGGAAYWLLRRQPEKSAAPPAMPPVRVVHDRPGGKVGEATAVLLLRRHFAPRVSDRCLATIMNGRSGDVYRFTVVNTCDRTRLGRWQVDVGTKEVSPALR